MTTEEILQRLQGVKRERPGQYIAKCPAHDDGKASLAVKAGEDGKTLLNCLAGCKLDDIVGALGLKAADLFPEREGDPGKADIVSTYPYHDERGELLYQVCRLVPKSFRQRRPDGSGGWTWKLGDVRRVLYRLPELVADTKGRTVFVVEGEKDVDTLRGLGFLATCCAGGANAWHHVAAHAADVLKGRPVVVIPDNDAPGRKYAADVVASLRGHAKTIRVLELPGLAEHGDVSDWVLAGGTAQQLVELARAAVDTIPELVGIDIGTTRQRLAGERERRLADAKRVVPFQVSYLDDQLGGLMPHDLVVLTAKAGAGKTQLASTIAERAARAGRRVVGFFLEADQSEIERRMKFRALAQIYADGEAARRAARIPPRTMAYAAWMRGELDDVLGPLDQAAEEWLAKSLGDRLRTVYRGSTFTLEDAERSMVALADHADMFVVDHLHYLDTPDEDNENRAVTRIMSTLRDLALRLGKPVLLVAHLRKEDMRAGIVPRLADLHGSSNITKIATRVIALAPAPHVGSDYSLAYTYVAVLKDRLDGALPITARVVYDRGAGTYQEDYQLGMAKRSGGDETWEPLKHLPHWAQRAVKGAEQ